MRITRRTAIKLLAGALPAYHVTRTLAGQALQPTGPFVGTRDSLAVPLPGMVPRREVRHLGALGTAVRR